jgi:CheY-like chemotaxis protein
LSDSALTRPVTAAGLALVAEDNTVNQIVARELLTALGFEVLIAGNGVEAVDALRKHDVDIVLMDCQMPVLDGYGAARMIRALSRPRAAAVPIIAVTADAMPGEDRKCREAGMDDFLSKPYTLQQLREVVARWQRVDTAPESPASGLQTAVLRSIRQLDPDDSKGLVAELLDAFVSTTESGMTELTAAVKANDLAEVARVAHALKAGAANIGALTLAEHYRQLERLGKQRDAVGVREMLAATEHARVQAVAAARLQHRQERRSPV